MYLSQPGKTPSGDDCPWCEDEDSDFMPEDFDDAQMTLCGTHSEEY
jgi:hypothetical protein